MSKFPNRKPLIFLIIGFWSLGFLLFYLLPAFRGDIEVRPDIYLGPLRIHLYGLTMALGILAGYLVVRKKLLGADDLLTWVVIFGLIGARAYFVIFSWEYFRENLIEIPQFWQGGLAIYGAVLGGFLGSYFYAKRNKIDWLNLINLAVVGLPLGQTIGRFGNFFNQEAFGYPTDLPWKMYVSPASRPLEYLSAQYFHPAFLYEAVWDGLVFLILWKKGGGRRVGLYLILYSLGRFFIESIRVDSFWIWGTRVDQITALVMITIGAALIFLSKKPHENRI